MSTKEEEVQLIISPEDIPEPEDQEMFDGEEQLPEEPTTTEPEAKSEEELQYGYVVGLSAKGDLVFKPVGSNPGLVELLGLHRYADHRLLQYVQQGEGGGLVAINERLGKLTQAIQFLVQLISQSAQQK